MPAPKGNKYAKGNKGGRPTKFSPGILTKTLKYISHCIDEDVQELSGLSAKGTELYRNRLKVDLPTVEGLARWLNVSKDTLYAWGKENKEFSDALDDLKSEQAKRLVNNGLSGLYNPTIAKLILSSNHGMREKTETDLTSQGKQIQSIIYLPAKPNSNGGVETK